MADTYYHEDGTVEVDLDPWQLRVAGEVARQRINRSKNPRALAFGVTNEDANMLGAVGEAVCAEFYRVWDWWAEDNRLAKPAGDDGYDLKIGKHVAQVKTKKWGTEDPWLIYDPTIGMDGLCTYILVLASPGLGIGRILGWATNRELKESGKDKVIHGIKCKYLTERQLKRPRRT